MSGRMADAIEQRFKEAMDGAYRALDELRRAGVVKAIGVGVNESAMCVRFARPATSTRCCWPAAIRCWSSPRSRTSCRWP